MLRGLIALGLLEPTPATAQDDADVRIVQRFEGTDTRLTDPMFRQFDSRERFVEFWKNHKGADSKAPPVDFSRHTVVVHSCPGPAEVHLSMAVRKGARGVELIFRSNGESIVGKSIHYFIAVIERAGQGLEIHHRRAIDGPFGDWPYYETARPSPAGNGYFVYGQVASGTRYAFDWADGRKRVGFHWEDVLTKDQLGDDPQQESAEFSGDGSVFTAKIGGHPVHFILPIGRLLDRTVREQIRMVDNPPTVDVDRLIAGLEADDIGLRSKAEKELKSKALSHLRRLREKRAKATGELRARLEEIVSELADLEPLLTLTKSPEFRRLIGE